jgi:ribose/xylose/arabinose/galactoside ABC-type transport system permease subunit
MSQASTTIDEMESTRGRVARAKIAAIIQRQGALIALVIICVGAFILFEDFRTRGNLENVLRQNSMIGLVALGMTFVILTGGIDLSVGSLVAVGGVIAANLAGRGTLVAVLAAVAFTTLLGLVNGLVIAKARIQPFIVTLAMMIAARGLALAYTGEQSVRIEKISDSFTWLGRGQVGTIPVPILILVALFILAWLVLNYTKFGRHVYAIGDNEGAARLMGLNVGRVTISVYALSGMLAGLAGVILASRLGTGQPVEGNGWELKAIASVVVGGTLLTGGQGGVGSTLVGVILFGVILNLFNLTTSLTPWWQQVLNGIFLLAVVIIQKLLSARK